MLDAPNKSSHPWEQLEDFPATFWMKISKDLLESNDPVRAEICIRTASALGINPSEAEPYFELAMKSQGLSPERFPLCTAGEGTEADQPPQAKDIFVLAQLAWREKISETLMLDYLRKCPTRDHVLARMISDPIFEKTNLSWMTIARDGDF